MKYNSIPILYYHSIANHEKERPWSFLSCKIEIFKAQMEYLYKKGYYTCNWDELYDHLIGKTQLPKKTVMIHFDDGFLDNWSVVFPIMKKYGLKFSIVVTPEFIQMTKEKRPFLKETTENNILDWWGYLSIEELKEMEKSGLVDIQAHGFTHTWYPTSDRIIDIYNGTQIEPWLYWNEHIEEKPYWLSKNLFDVIPYGMPIFEHEKSLANLKAFIPDKNFVEDVIDLYDKNHTKDEILKQVLELKEKKYNNLIGRYETEEETKQRLLKELKGTKEFLEKYLDKRIEYLVWPGGGNNELVEKLAFEVGYKLISKGNKFNSFNSNIKKVMRMAACHENFDVVLNKWFFIMQIKRGSGNILINDIVSFIKKIKKVI